MTDTTVRIAVVLVVAVACLAGMWLENSCRRAEESDPRPVPRELRPGQDTTAEWRTWYEVDTLLAGPDTLCVVDTIHLGREASVAQQSGQEDGWERWVPAPPPPRILAILAETLYVKGDSAIIARWRERYPPSPRGCLVLHPVGDICDWDWEPIDTISVRR